MSSPGELFLNPLLATIKIWDGQLYLLSNVKIIVARTEFPVKTLNFELEDKYNND